MSYPITLVLLVAGTITCDVAHAGLSIEHAAATSLSDAFGVAYESDTVKDAQAAEESEHGQALNTLQPRERQAWISAIGNDRTDLLATLLKNYQAELLLPLSAPNGKSALMVASKKGDLPLAKALIAAGADVHQMTQTSGTAFMFAVLGNKHEMAKWLVNQGANIHSVGSNGWSALTIAAAKGNVDLLRWLIDLGADTQTRDVYRFTPFLRAVDNGYEKAAAMLLALPETDVNARDEYDNTALHHAVSARNIDMVKLLVTHNANALLSNRDGVTALELAKGSSELEELLDQYRSRPVQDSR